MIEIVYFLDLVENINHVKKLLEYRLIQFLSIFILKKKKDYNTGSVPMNDTTRDQYVLI